MASLIVDQANMASERDVVKEEHRLRVENAPYGRMFEQLQALCFRPRIPTRIRRSASCPIWIAPGLTMCAHFTMSTTGPMTQRWF